MGAGRVIATATGEERRGLAMELGADAAIDPKAEDLTAALVEANGGEPVDVVFETAGGRIFDQSFDALAPFGRIVQYGLSTREKSQVSNAKLLRTSRGVVGFWLMHAIGRPGMLREPLADLFERAARGEFVARVGEASPLSVVARAHEDLLSRRTSGKLVVDPSIA
jgi:NADPH2:quinone reductase